MLIKSKIISYLIMNTTHSQTVIGHVTYSIHTFDFGYVGDSVLKHQYIDNDKSFLLYGHRQYIIYSKSTVSISIGRHDCTDCIELIFWWKVKNASNFNKPNIAVFEIPQILLPYTVLYLCYRKLVYYASICKEFVCKLSMSLYH